MGWGARAGGTVRGMIEHLELAERLFKAIEAGDIDAVRAIYAPGVEIWHNTDGMTQSAADNLRTLTWITENLKGVTYTQIRRSATDDGFVQQHVLVATNRAGQRVEVPACIVTTIVDGKVTRLDEYLDSASVGAIMAT
jgi:ketosteroid isomerase-like protein